MTTYTKLVDKIFKVPSIVQELSENEDPTLLDLVNLDWHERLVNHPLYQDYVTESKQKYRPPTLAKTEAYNFQKIHNPDHHLKVRLVSKCLIPNQYTNDIVKEEKGFPLLLQDSEPLKMIVDTMTKDLGPEYRYDDNSKVYLDFCSYLSCSECSDCIQKFRAKGHPVADKNQTCIRNIKVFDGKNVFNRFGTQTRDMFKVPFVGIVELELTGRYFYKSKSDEGGSTVRIAGKLINLLAFKEEMLSRKGNVFIGDLTPAYEVEDESGVSCDNTMNEMFGVDKPNSRKRPHEDDVAAEEEDFLSATPAQQSKSDLSTFDELETCAFP